MDRTEHHIIPPGDGQLLAMIRNTDLSFAARGLLLVVIDHPDVQPRREWLFTQSPDKQRVVIDALRELTDAGYRLVEDHKNPDETWTHRVTWSAVPR